MGPVVGRSRDVVVIGAGIIGCAAAYELARRGAAVTLIDDRDPGGGATQASAGVLAPYIEAGEHGLLLELTIRSLGLYDDFVGRAAGDSGMQVPYRRTGTLEVALHEDGMRKLRSAAAFLAGRDVPAELLDQQAARAAEAHLTADVAGALLTSAHGFVSAHDLTRALIAGAGRRGADVRQERVHRIAAAGPDLTIASGAGMLTARTVVLAAGSWSGQIDIPSVAARVPVRPVRGQLLRVAWQGARLRRVTWGERCYLVPWDDGTLLVGATVEDAGFDERATVAGVRDLLDAAAELVPHSWTAGFLGARVGLRPATPDGLPIVGRSRVLPNLVYATGHYRNGVLLAPLTAVLIAELVLADRTDAALDGLSPGRFGPL